MEFIKVDIQDPWSRYDGVDEVNLDYVKYILLQAKTDIRQVLIHAEALLWSFQASLKS